MRMTTVVEREMNNKNNRGLGTIVEKRRLEGNLCSIACTKNVGESNADLADSYSKAPLP